LKITTESLKNRQVRLIIEIDEEQTQEALQGAAHHIAKQVNIPGFRKGKAPYDVILQRFGEDTLRQEAAESLIEEVYDKALEQEGIKPFAPATLDQIELDPITFTFMVPLSPTIELGNYQSYRLKYKKAKVSKKEVQEALEDIRLQNAVLELVERPVEMGDGAVVDLAATANGEEILKGDDVHIMVEAGGYPADGFSEAIVGMHAGDERTFSLPLSDDFPREDLRGQEAEFTVSVAEVYDQTLPDLDDDLARTVGSFDSLKELEAQVKDQLRQAAQQEIDQEYAEQVVEDILKQTEMAYPPDLLEETLDDVAEEFERAIKREAKLSLADYLRFQSKTEEELREELEPNAKARLERSLLLSEVVSQEGLDVQEEEINAQIELSSAPWGVRADEVRASLSSEEGQQAIRNRLLGGKAVQRLVAIAKGEAHKGDKDPGKADGEEA
jgi:trigger factor